MKTVSNKMAQCVWIRPVPCPLSPPRQTTPWSLARNVTSHERNQSQTKWLSASGLGLSPVPCLPHRQTIPWSLASNVTTSLKTNRFSPSQYGPSRVSHTAMAAGVTSMWREWQTSERCSLESRAPLLCRLRQRNNQSKGVSLP